MSNIIEDGVYEIAIDESELVLDVEKESTDDGTQIIAFERQNKPNQFFRITNLEDDIYNIIALQAFKAIAVDEHSGEVKIAEYNPNKDAMKWRFIEVWDGMYKIENVGNGLVLDLEAAQWRNETRICTFPYHMGSNQHFRLNKKSIGDVNIQQGNSNFDFDNIMDLLKSQPPQKPTMPIMPTMPTMPVMPTPPTPPTPQSTDAFTQMQAMLENMQKQLDDMRKNQEDAEAEVEVGKLNLAALQDEINALQEENISLMGNMLNDNDDIKALTAISNATKFDKLLKVITTCVFTSLDDVDEDGLSAALEPFTNPRRVKLLKVLIEKDLPSNEISQTTGLVGGQLYHHLQNLESAGLIEKLADRYRATDSAKSVLCAVYTAIGGMRIAQEDSADISELVGANRFPPQNSN